MSTIALPLPTDGPNFEGLEGTVMGFGRFNDDEQDGLSVNLRYISKTVVPSAECSAAHPDFYSEDNFCTEPFFGSTCLGDEGAPFGKKTLSLRQNF